MGDGCGDVVSSVSLVANADAELKVTPVHSRDLWCEGQSSPQGTRTPSTRGSPLLCPLGL